MVFDSSRDRPLVVKSDKAIVKVGSATMIALDVTIEFQRQVDIVPTLSEQRVVSIGIPQGRFSANTVLAQTAGDLEGEMHINDGGCEPAEITVDLSAGCDAANKSVHLYGCYASAVNIGMQGGRGYVAEGVTVTFTGMEIGDSTSA